MSEGGLTFNRRAVRPMQCLREGWQLIKKDYWLFLGITLVGLLLAGLVPMYLLMGPMMCGIYLCLLRRQVGQRVSFDMLFKGFDYFAQSLIATLITIVPLLLFVMLFVVLFYVAIFLFVIAPLGGPVGSQQNQPPDMTVAWVFGALYGVFFVVLSLVSLLYGALFMFLYPLIVDRGLTGWEAVKLSVRAALANLGGVIGLMLLSFLLGLLGVLACYVGAIFEYPLGLAMIAVAYRQVFPVESSVLFEPAPSNWPEAGERFSGAEQTGVQQPVEGPLTVTAAPPPPPDPGTQPTDGTPGQP